MKAIRVLIVVLCAMAVVCRGQVLPAGWYNAANFAAPIHHANIPPPATQAAPANLLLQPLTPGTSTNFAEANTPEIQALAQGLENDPLRIFQYVHDHIRHVMYFGSKKGAQLTLLEQSGNDFDQCALLVALLQAAGYSNVGYKFGLMQMPYDSPDHNDLHHWLTLTMANTNWQNTTNLFSYLITDRGYPTNLDITESGSTNLIVFQRIWVTLTIGSTTYYLDPAFKISEPVSGINLTTAMGLDINALTNAAGGTATADYVQGLNETSLRSTLTGFTTNLLNTLQSNYPNASVAQILGGQRIVPWTNALSQSLMFATETRGGLYPILSWQYEPSNLMATLTVGFAGTNCQWLIPQLQGSRLSLTFSNGLGQLWQDDTLMAQAQTSGSTVPVTLSVYHPFDAWSTANTFINDHPRDGQSDNTHYYKTTNANYALIYAFDASHKWLQERQQKLEAYRQQGLSDTSRQVITESLNVMGLGWFLQTELNDRMLAQEIGELTQHHHRLGRMAQEAGNGYYVDVYLQVSGLFPNSGIDSQSISNLVRGFDASAYFGSAMEHAIIEQLQNSGLIAASTDKMLEIANSKNQKIYLGNSNNWTTGANVRSKLVNYDPLLSTFDSQISLGYNFLFCTNGHMQVAGSGSWAGLAYVRQRPLIGGEDIGMIIGPALQGGFVSDPTAAVSPSFVDLSAFSQPIFFNPTPVTTLTLWNGDPVSMSDATFRVSTADLSLGGSEPLGMTLTRFYTPTRRYLNLDTMANGWVNSYYSDLEVVSAPEAALGSTTPAQMASMLVGTWALANFHNAQPNPKDWMVTALIAKWAVDQTISNAVSISLGNDTIQFIKQPNGALTPPAGSMMSLTKGSTYSLQQRHGNTFAFNSNGKLASVTDPSGNQLSLTYTSGRLTQAKDWQARTLTFTYSGTPTALTKVKDSFSPNRTVLYGYTTNVDGNPDLTSVTDPDGNTSTYVYDTNHQLVATFDALNRLVVTNIYDSFGHVVTQYTQGDTNKTWNIFWSGWETVSQDPAENKQRYFYDDDTRVIGQQDELGNLTQNIYDGQDHVVATISPLNETNLSIYDGQNNVTNTIDALGFTNQFVYDANNNLIRQIDARGNTSSFAYNANFQVTAQTNGAGDWTTFTYNTDGTLAKRTDIGGTATNTYNGNGFLLKTAFPGGLGSEGFKYDLIGNLLSHTNALGFVTSFQYDLRRHQTNAISPTNVTTSVVYDAVGNQVSATDSRGFVSSSVWSVTQHKLSTTLPATPQGTPVLTNIYDNRDWLVESKDPLQNATFYTNDAAQRLVSSIDPLLRSTYFVYDNDGRNIFTTNAAGQVTQQNWDSRGELLRVADPASRVFNRVYDPVGNQVILTNRNGNMWTFQFDAANRVTNTISPLNRQAKVTYDHRGKVSTATQPAGQITTNLYDAKGRLTNRFDAVASTVFCYDANDEVTNIVENGKTNAWTYDAYLHVSSCTDTSGNNIQYRYDANGNLTNLVYAGGRNIYYAYDSLNRVTNLTDWAGRQTTFAYDLASRPTSITRPNGTVRTMKYDAAGQLTNIWEQGPSGAMIALFKMHWNSAAQMDWEFAAPVPHTVTVPTRNVTFNADDRIATFDASTLSYDANGNLFSGPLTNDTLVVYTYDGRNRMLNAGGVTNFYDAANNRIGQTFGTNVTSYVVNPNARVPEVLIRIKNAVTNYYVYGPSGLLYESDETGGSVTLVTYHYDYRGSTVALTDANGNVTDRVEYSAYGLMTYRSGRTDTPFLYNGEYGVQTDPNGLLYMQARYYNAYISRFLNPDPSQFAGGLNFYSFASGNPISLLDPSGLIGNPVRWQYGAAGPADPFSRGSTLSPNGAFYVPPSMVPENGWQAAAMGFDMGVIGAVTVALAAPAAVSGLTAVGVSATTATAAVTTTVGVTGAIGGAYTVYDASVNAAAGNWNNVWYDVGTIGGGALVGGIGGGRFIADYASPTPSTVPYSWNPFTADYQTTPTAPNGYGFIRNSALPLGEDLWNWAGTGPTPSSGGGAAMSISSGASVLMGSSTGKH